MDPIESELYGSRKRYSKGLRPTPSLPRLISSSPSSTGTNNVVHPATVTHGQLTESIDDLLWDLEQAFAIVNGGG